MAEQFLNLVWLSIAILSFAVVLPSVKTRRFRAVIALAGLLALLFPVISISDDLTADSSAQDLVVVLFTVAALMILLAAIARLLETAPVLVSFATVKLTDPRSPPRA